MIIVSKIGILELMNPLEQFFFNFSKLEHQLYLEVVKVKKYRIAMSKLRVSSHRLEIEVGWWSRPNKKNHFFSKLEHQLYLIVVKVKKYRIAMSKLRASSHRLEI